MAAKDAKSAVRRTFVAGSCLIVLLAPILNLDAHAQPLSDGTIVSGKVVEHESGVDARVPNVVLSFLGSNGATTRVESNGDGEYSAKLSSGQSYSLTVTSRTLCPVHRPPFDARPGRKVKLDIVLVVDCPRDVVLTGPDVSDSDLEEFCAKAGTYYCEQHLTIEGKVPVTMVIGFASRTLEGERILYGSSLKSYAIAGRRAETPDHFSVSVAFGTYTIRAKSVTVDSQKKTLSARGNLSITHDDLEISVGSPCMNIRFDDQEPAVQSCD
jgi:hypothetical protein